MTNILEHKYLNFRDYWDQFEEGFPEKHINFDSEQFVSYCNIRTDEKVLEIGMGGGDSCRLISERTTDCIFIDFNWKAVFAQKKRSSYLNIICGDCNKMPFKSKFFDKIMARYVIHNFPDHSFRTLFYKESARVIKDNGQLIMCMVPNKVGMFFDLKNYIDTKLRHRLAKRHGTFWPLSIKSMIEELHHLGFELVEIRKTPEPQIGKMYYKFRQAARRFFLPLITANPLIYNWVDLKFKKIAESY